MKEILRIGSQIAHGLAAAHKQGLIHRDVKPANILLENGVERVKITDFGLARAVDDLSVTRTGEVAGTPQYMSPEQGQGMHVDHRSDLFSLGSVLYAMCTGRPPFRGNNPLAIIRKVVDETPRPIREVNPDIPDWLCAIIDRLLAKDPEDRYQTAAEVANELEESLARLQYARRLHAAGRTGARATLASHRETPPGPQVARGDRPARLRGAAGRDHHQDHQSRRDPDRNQGAGRIEGGDRQGGLAAAESEG